MSIGFLSLSLSLIFSFSLLLIYIFSQDHYWFFCETIENVNLAISSRRHVCFQFVPPLWKIISRMIQSRICIFKKPPAALFASRRNFSWGKGRTRIAPMIDCRWHGSFGSFFPPAYSASQSLTVFSAYFSVFCSSTERAQPSGSHSPSRAVIDLLNYRAPGVDDVLFLGIWDDAQRLEGRQLCQYLTMRVEEGRKEREGDCPSLRYGRKRNT